MAANGAADMLLEENGLALEDGQSFLEASKFSLAPALALAVRVGLCGTHLLELGLVLQDCRELGLDTLAVRMGLRSRCIELGSRPGFIVDSLLGSRPVNLVRLGFLIVGGLCRKLGGHHLRDSFGKVGLHNLQHADDAVGRTTRGRVPRIFLRVVLAQDLHGHLDCCQASLHFRFVAGEDCLFLGTDLVQLALCFDERREALLEIGDLLLELGRLGSFRVDARGKFVDICLLVCLLVQGIPELLVTICLVRSIRMCIAFKFREHVFDQALHLAEGVWARVRTVADRGCHPAGKLHQGLVMLGLGELPDEAHGLEVCQVSRVPHGRLLEAASELQKAGLAHAVSYGPCTRGLLGNDFLSLAESLEFLATAFDLGLIILRLGHAVLLQGALRRQIDRQFLLCGTKVALPSGLRIALHGQARTSLVQVLVGELDFVLEALLEHVEIVLVVALLLPGVVHLRLGLVQEILQHFHNVLAVALVDRSIRRPPIIRVAITIALRALYQSRELGRVGRPDKRGAQQGLDRLHDTVGLLHLQHRRRTSLAHLAFQDADGALERTDDVDELSIGLREVLLLGLADPRGRLQVGLVRGDARGELLNLGLMCRNCASGLLDVSLQFLDVGLARLDLEFQIPGALLTPFGVLRIGLVRLLALFDDLRLEVGQKLNNLLHRTRLPGHARGEAKQQPRAGQHCGQTPALHDHSQAPKKIV
mmetsp:Transcript_71917/g.181773  ORF Transcript_71917/g.181773 Transcript_71917/m.181773 type:complete len:705 (+) Transcript_71917:148-2262(+)